MRERVCEDYAPKYLYVGNNFVKTQVNKTSVTRISQIRMPKGNVVKQNLSTTENITGLSKEIFFL